MSKYERDADKEAFWRLAMGEQRDGGLSVRAFCAREGLTQSNFYAWRRRLARREVESPAAEGLPRFVEVTPPEPPAPPAPPAPPEPPGVPPVVTGDDVPSPLELVLPRGVVVRVPDRFDAKALRRVVEALT